MQSTAFSLPWSTARPANTVSAGIVRRSAVEQSGGCANLAAAGQGDVGVGAHREGS